MSRQTFIEVHKLTPSGLNVEPTAALINATSIQSITKFDDHCVIELIGRDRATFSVAESYETVVERLNQIKAVSRG